MHQKLVIVFSLPEACHGERTASPYLSSESPSTTGLLPIDHPSINESYQALLDRIGLNEWVAEVSAAP